MGSDQNREAREPKGAKTSSDSGEVKESKDFRDTKRDLMDEGKSLLGDTFKKVFATGVSAAFMTEESIRSYLGEIKLPKEILSTLIQSANKSKEDITNRVSKEIIGIVSQIDWVKEFAKFAEGHKFRVSAEIEIIKKKADIAPSVQERDEESKEEKSKRDD